MSTMSKKRQAAWTLDAEPLDAIAAHVRRHEGAPPFPYLDSKGNVTVGAGRLVPDLETFKRIDLEVDGRPATAAEKERAWNALQSKREALLRDANEQNRKHGDGTVPNPFNQDAINFKDTTAVNVPDTEIARDLDAQIAARLPKVREIFGPDVWDALDDDAKAVAVDLHFGEDQRLKEWEGLIDRTKDYVAAAREAESLPPGSPERAAAEARKRDARARMASETLIHSGTYEARDPETGAVREIKQRNWGRVSGNFCSLNGIAGQDCWRALSDDFATRDKDAETFPETMKPFLPPPWGTAETGLRAA